jgi:hypothetical protein
MSPALSHARNNPLGCAATYYASKQLGVQQQMSKSKKAASPPPQPVDEEFEVEPGPVAGGFRTPVGLRDLLIAGVLLALLVQIVLTAYVLGAQNRLANLTNQMNTQQNCVQRAQVDAQSQTDYQARYKKCVEG